VANELLVTVDQTLIAQAREESGGGPLDADTGGGATLGQNFGPTGRLRRSQPATLPRLVGREVVAEALAGRRRIWLDRHLSQAPGRVRHAGRAEGPAGAACPGRDLAARGDPERDACAPQRRLRARAALRRRREPRAAHAARSAAHGARSRAAASPLARGARKR